VKLCYGGQGDDADIVAATVEKCAKYNVYGVYTCDYNFSTGEGDLLQIVDGKVFYHIGYCSMEDKLNDEEFQKLQNFSPLWEWNSRTIGRQPPGIPSTGVVFEWKPSDGDVMSAGRHVKKNSDPKARTPWHLFGGGDRPRGRKDILRGHGLQYLLSPYSTCTREVTEGSLLKQALSQSSTQNS
jgi:hypothetical protein